MKKIIVTLVLCCTLLLCSCSGPSTFGDAEHNVQFVHGKYFEAEILERGTTYYIIEDKLTGYKYLVVGGWNSAVMTRIN